MSSAAPPLDRNLPLQRERGRPLERARGRWGMWLFIATEAMLFALLFFAYAYLGASSPEWPPEPDPSLTYPLVLLGILLSSSVVLHYGERAILSGHQKTLRIALTVTLALGALFLVVQRFEYVQHLRTLKPGTNAYGSIFYTIISFHVAHIIVGALMLLHVLARAFARHFTEERHLAVRNVSLYWHFVDAVWVLIVLLLYVSPHLSG